MKDFMGLMKQAKEMQDKLQTMQQEMSEIEAVGNAGGDLVTLTLSGKGQMRSLSIDPSLFAEDEVEILEDLILAAHNDAKEKIERITVEKTQELTGGMSLPPGMKLPFG